jgi:hypothetical protein
MEGRLHIDDPVHLARIIDSEMTNGHAPLQHIKFSLIGFVIGPH